MRGLLFMKKKYLIGLIALFAIAFDSIAQDNTYNMVIEMANGTKITINPNDIKDISFNNGELIISGEEVNSLVEQQKLMYDRITALETMIQDTRCLSEDAKYMIGEQQEQIEELRAQSYATRTFDEVIDEKVNKLTQDFADARTLIDMVDVIAKTTKEETYELKEVTHQLKYEVEDLQCKVEKNTVMIEDAYKMIEVLKVGLETLAKDYAQRAEVEQAIDNLKEKTQRLANQVFGNGEFYDWGF